MTHRNTIDNIKTGVTSQLREQSGGNLLTGQAMFGVQEAWLQSGLSCGTWEPGLRW